jgi:hypothetical protein
METPGRINDRLLPGRLAFRRSSESRLVEPGKRAFELVARDSCGNSGLVATKLRANRIQSDRSVKRPKRELISCPQARIAVINEIQTPVFQRTAVGFDVAKSKRVKRTPVLVRDLHNYLVLTRSFFHRDYLCRNRAHQELTFYGSAD